MDAESDFKTLATDVEAFYRRHASTLELWWPSDSRTETARLIQEQYRLVTEERRWDGMMVLAVDPARFCVISIPRANGGGKKIERMDFTSLPADLWDLCKVGTFEGMARIEARSIWRELDFPAREYGHVRGSVSPLVRRAMLQGLLDAAGAELDKRLPPLLTEYRNGREIAARLVDTVCYLVVEVEFPGEEKAVAALRRRYRERLGLTTGDASDGNGGA